MRVLAVSSGGGHWVQLRRIVPAFEGCEVIFAVANGAHASEVPHARVHVVNDATRWNKFGLLLLALRLLRILLRERPAVVVSTGAAPGCLALFLGRLLGARTIWVDSIANVQQLSLSARLVRPAAGLWLTQWESLSTPDGPDFAGRVF